MGRHLIALVFLVMLPGLLFPTGSLEASQVDLEDADIGSGLRIEDMRFELGYLEGRLCNESGGILDEVGFYLKTYDRSGVQLWDQTVDLRGINHDECRGFYVKEKFDGYRTVEKWDAIPVFFNPAPIGPHADPNDEVYIKSLEIDLRDLSGALCSNLEEDRDDVFLSVLGPGYDGKVAIRARGFVGLLPAGSCAGFSLYLDTRVPVDTRQEFLFKVYEIPARGPNGSGRITRGLAYENLSYRREYLNAILFNRSASPREKVFIKFYGLNADNEIVIEKSYFIEEFDPGERFRIRDRLYEHERVSSWRFSLAGWN